MSEESKHALQTFQTAVDLKFLRSVVRANEIQATLQQARSVANQSYENIRNKIELSE